MKIIAMILILFTIPKPINIEGNTDIVGLKNKHKFEVIIFSSMGVK